MFGRRRKRECHRIREMFSPYLDDCLTSLERDAVQFHIEICEDCEWELRSLGATVQLLRRMPAASAPRSFTLAEAPARRDGVPFALPGMKRLRLATTLAVVLLAILLAGDFSGLFHGDVIVEPPPEVADVAVPEDTAPEHQEGDIPVQQAEDPPGEIADWPPEATEPVDGRVTQRVEPGQEWDLPAEHPELPEAVAPLRKPYPWLRPLQIASAALLVILGGAHLLVWQRKRGLTLHKAS